MAKRRLRVKLNRKHAMTVTRVSLGGERLVYVIQAQKKLKYPWGRSRIALHRHYEERDGAFSRRAPPSRPRRS